MIKIRLYFLFFILICFIICNEMNDDEFNKLIDNYKTTNEENKYKIKYVKNYNAIIIFLSILLGLFSLLLILYIIFILINAPKLIGSTFIDKNFLSKSKDDKKNALLTPQYQSQLQPIIFYNS